MSIDSAFRPSGNTVKLSVTSDSSVSATQWTTGNMSQCFVANPSSCAVWLVFGSSVQAGGGTAGGVVLPTTGTPAQGLVLPSSAARAFSMGPNATNCSWISAMTSGSAATATVYVTPGVGF